MSVPTLPHLNGPRARGFTCKPLQHKTCASSLSHARSLTQRPTRPSAYTVPGRAQDSHPHSLKRARSSPTPASCPTQPSLPITPGFYHDSYTHAQKHPRMWHSSAASNHTYAHAFCFPRSKSRWHDHIQAHYGTAPEKSQTCHIRAPFYAKTLTGRRPTGPLSSKGPSQSAPSNMLAQSIPYALCAIQSEEYPLLDRKSRPTNVERLSIKPCEVSTGLGFNHPKPSIKNVLGARFTQRPLRSRASQPWEQQPSSWADAAREPGWSRRPQPQSPGREQQPSWTG